MKFFSDLSDLEGIERTQDIEYIKLIRTHMNALGFWPCKEVGEVETKRVFYYRVYIFLLELICYFPGLLYIKNNFAKLKLLELGQTYVTVLMNTVALSRLPLVFMKKYRTLFGDFITTIHLFNHKHKSDYFMEMHHFVHKMSHFFSKYVITALFIGVTFFNVTPLYNNIVAGVFKKDKPANSTYDHSVYYELPFDYVTNFNGFLVVFTFNWYISYICASCLCTFDLFLSLIIFHLWGHLKILIHNLDNFPRPKADEGIDNSGRKIQENRKISDVMFSAEELRNVRDHLRENILHHQLIIDFSGRISDTFGLTLMIYYAIHQIVGCILLLECSEMSPRAITRYGPLTLFFFQQLIQISTIFELLGSLNDVLVNAIYCLPWEYMDTKNRKIVHFYLSRAQVSMSVKAGGMVGIGVQTMLSILKTSFSYYLLLRSVASDSI